MRPDAGDGLGDRALVGRLWAFVRPYRAIFWTTIVLAPVNQVLGVVQPYLLKLGIDRGIGRGDVAMLDRLAVALGLAVAGEALTAYAQQYLTTVVAQRSLADLRLAVFARLQRLPLRFFDRTPIGRLVSSLTTDVDVVNEVFAAGVATIVLDAVRLAAILGFMLWIDVRLACTSLAVLPVVLVALDRFRRAARRLHDVVRERVAAVNGQLQEAISGTVVLALAGREARAVADLAASNAAHRDAIGATNRVEVGLFSLVEAVSTVSVAVMLWEGGRLHARGTVEIGTIVAFVQYLQQFFVPIREFSAKYAVLQSAASAARRIFALLDVAEEPVPVRPRVGRRAAGEIVFDRVWFSYDPPGSARRWVLRDVSFRVAPGEHVAIVGPTGSGKSTVVKLLERFYDVQRGRILVDGVDVRAWDPAALRRRIAVVLQDVFVFSGTVGSNVTLGRDVDRGAVERALGAADLGARLGGIDGPVRERGSNLSAGERQLLSFARALAGDPAVLVLDEATSSVDPATERAVQAALGRMLAGRTAIVVAHRLATVEAADRVLVIENGVLREQGTAGTLVARGGAYAGLRHAWAGASAAPAAAG